MSPHETCGAADCVQCAPLDVLMGDSSSNELNELHQWLVLMANESDAHDSQMLMKAANIVGERTAHEPCPVEAKERARDVHYALIERFDLKDTPTANSIVRIMLERLAGLAQPPGREWQPIETAPKGIKVIAGYPNRLGKWRSVMACYYLPGTLACDDDSADDDGYAPAGWYEESETHDHIMRTDELPTHWMPLPASPLTKCECCTPERKCPDHGSSITSNDD